MKHLTIGIFHDEKLGKELGKRGTESDILMFNRKTDDCIFTFMSPIEDKLAPKTQIISSIDAAIINCGQITPEVGETILLLDSAGVKEGILISPQYSDTTRLANMIKDTSLKNFIITERNLTRIMEIIEKIKPERDLLSPAIVTTDHSFSVKGVGEVTLGFVKQGTINTHDTMILLPASKEVMIRSIQMQDKDFDKATAGCRVGLAIKGATVEEMKRGTIFSAPEGAKTGKKFTLNFTKNRFYQEVKKGMFYATIGMQSIPINIMDITGDSITIETEKPVCYTKNDRFILLDLNAKKLHLIGTGRIV